MVSSKMQVFKTFVYHSFRLKVKSIALFDSQTEHWCLTQIEENHDDDEN